MSLARLGGYGFVYVGDPDSDATQAKPVGVTMAFRDERFDRALNSVLLASGFKPNWMAAPDGGHGDSSKTFGPQMSKVFRLNQVKVIRLLTIWPVLGRQ